MPTLWPKLADLPLTIEGYELERLQRDVSSAFTRVSTVIHLHGGGHEGIGEDVSYVAEDQDALQNAGAVQPLAGEWTLESFCDHLATLELWPEPARHEASVLYRVWAYESAALDLALAQAGTSLHAALGREPRPVRFVCSTRLATEGDALAPVTDRLARYPTLEFKLDPTSAWDDAIVDALQATGAVESVDFKSFYVGTPVDTPADPALYARVLAAFPDAFIEDPHDLPEVRELLRGHEDRVSYDAPIHSVADIESLPIAPKLVNVKPSRLGGLRPLLEAYAYCEERGIGMYGGGQFELGIGRGHIQYLASLFHPDSPNDVAPGGYNDNEPPPGLPDSPLPVAAGDTGFRWGMSETWPYTFVDAIRYGDLDANGHLNNVAVHQFYESARVAYMRDLMQTQSGAGDALGVIFAETHVNFRSPGFYPETLQIDVRPEQLARSSVRIAFRIRTGEDDRLVAEGWGTLVGFDYAAGRAAPLAPELTAALSAAIHPEET